MTDIRTRISQLAEGQRLLSRRTIALHARIEELEEIARGQSELLALNSEAHTAILKWIQAANDSFDRISEGFPELPFQPGEVPYIPDPRD